MSSQTNSSETGQLARTKHFNGTDTAHIVNRSPVAVLARFIVV